MEPVLKKVLIVILSVAVVAPTAIVLYHYMSVSDQASNPLAYIPDNSTMVAGINYNGTQMYAFYASGSPALVVENLESLLSLNTSSVTGVSNTSNSSPLTSSLGVSLSTWGTVHGFQIYRVKINETGFNTINSKFPSFVAGFLKPIEANLSINLYAYNPYGLSFIVGSLNSLNHSINAYAGSHNFVSHSSYLNSLSNMSFYISGDNSSLFRSVTGNVTMNSTQVYFNMASTKLYDMYNISRQDKNFTNFSAVWNTPLQLEIKLGIGLGNPGSMLKALNLTGVNQNYFAAYLNN
jgi:hypothetical protein